MSVWGVASWGPAVETAPEGLAATKSACADSDQLGFSGDKHMVAPHPVSPRRRTSWPQALRRGFNRWPTPLASQPTSPFATHLAPRSSPVGEGRVGAAGAPLPSPFAAQSSVAWERSEAINVENLTKTFEVRPVLRRVNFSVAAGERVTLLGPNGAGKTTLLRILATLAQPTSGRVVVAGYDLRDDANEARWRIGYVGHQTGLYDELTARENLLFFARMFGLRDGARRADALLTRVGLRARANERVTRFSRGQAQRLALARAILHDPDVLLLDEPDTGLDEDALTLLTELLDERAEAGQTSLFTTHQLARGLAQSDRALILVGGRAVYDGPSAALDVATVRAYYAGKADDADSGEYEYAAEDATDEDEGGAQ